MVAGAGFGIDAEFFADDPAAVGRGTLGFGLLAAAAVEHALALGDDDFRSFFG